MTTYYLADTGVFVRCGAPDNAKYQRLRRAVRTAGARLLVPQRVAEELGAGAPAEYQASSPWQDALDADWVVVADDLEYTRSVVSQTMDEARRFIASETDRDEDTVEMADAAIVGLTAQVLVSGEASHVVLTTDKPLGKAVERLLPTWLREAGRVPLRQRGFPRRPDARGISGRILVRTGRQSVQ